MGFTVRLPNILVSSVHAEGGEGDVKAVADWFEISESSVPTRSNSSAAARVDPILAIRNE
jgi:hypothetical protein